MRTAFVAVIGGVILLAGCAKEFPTAKMAAGTRIQFVHASQVDFGCISMTAPDIEVVMPPKHGKIEVIHKKIHPTGFDRRNPLYKCRRGLVDGVVALYKPDAGFRGEDFLKIKITYRGQDFPTIKYYTRVIKVE